MFVCEEDGAIVWSLSDIVDARWSMGPFDGLVHSHTLAKTVQNKAQGVEATHS